MFREIVIPKNNEEEFIEIASKLGIKKLYFLYDFDEYMQNQKPKAFDFDVEIGFIVNQKNINKAVKQTELLVVKSSDKDRFFIESKKIKLVYGLEETYKKDYLHQRASGLNHVICEIARKNNVTIGFAYSILFNKDEYERAVLMGRMMQNIKLCQKYKVKTLIGSFSEKPFELRAPHDLKSLFVMLGMNQIKPKNSLTNSRESC